MSSPRFLLDENVPPYLGMALRRREPVIDVLRVGDPAAPPLGTLDPDLLLAGETLGRTLVTFDRKTMSEHLQAHAQAGHATAGVVLMRQGHTLARFVNEILLIWGASTADEWVNVTMTIP
jgi:hypothetical protein